MAKKIIPLLPQETTTEEDVFTDRVSLDELKKVWGENAEGYTDSQLYKIRDFTYMLCEVIYKIINKQPPTIIPLNHEPSNQSDDQSYTVRPGEYRRAS